MTQFQTELENVVGAEVYIFFRYGYVKGILAKYGEHHYSVLNHTQSGAPTSILFRSFDVCSMRGGVFPSIELS